MFNEVSAQLESEYPQLGAITVKQQFKSGLDRAANTFLVSTLDERTFVAKGILVANSIQKLSTEWWALKLIMERAPGTAPRLLFPEHKPMHFVLMEFLRGTNAETELVNGSDPAATFTLIGKELARLHAVKVDSFGTPEAPVDDWKTFVQQKLAERFNSALNFLPVPLAEKTQSYTNSLLPALENEVENQPVLIHRDPYPHNVLLTPEKDRATLLDYAMAMGGRPFFDFAKVLLYESKQRANITEAFLSGYGLSREEVIESKELIRLYTIIEILGQISYFERIQMPDKRRATVETLERFVTQDTSLLS